MTSLKEAWRALGQLAPEKLTSLKRVATIVSIGFPTRIEGSQLSYQEVEILLGNLEIKKFMTSYKQEVAEYWEVMNIIFQSYQDIPGKNIAPLQKKGMMNYKPIQYLKGYNIIINFPFTPDRV